MKDLKHLIYFESLLENADNELVKQAQAEGDICLGYTCYHVPEALLNIGNCFSVRLRAPKTGSIDIATYYMSNYTCEYRGRLSVPRCNDRRRRLLHDEPRNGAF